MSITALDIKFKQPQRLTDFDDGGGRMSAVEIVDNAMNNVFSDRSDLDGIIGRVSLREVFFQVDTANTDTFLGPYIFLSDPPADPNVSVCLFDLGKVGIRSEARSAYENYRNRGVKSQFILYGAHFVGQRTVQVYCRTEIASPDIGDVLCLSIEKDGFTPEQQFVAVQEVSLRQTVNFTDGSGDFARDVLIITITEALQFDFPGIEDPQRISGTTAPTLVRLTQVSNSAKYYGVKPCTINPQTGDLVVNVGDPYIPAVPSTQAETPLVDQLAGLGTQAFIKASADGALTYAATLTGAAGVTVSRYFGSPYAPGTLNITVGAVALRDDGSGSVVAVDPANTGWSGTADYQNGLFGVAKDTGFSGALAATATAAGIISQQAYSRAIAITPANRNISFVFQLPGQPSAGTVVVDYLALGKWIRLLDDGRGHLSRNPGEGSGTVNYATGSVAVTLGALPDNDSALIIAWGTDLRARNSSGEITIPAPTFRQQLAHGGIVPGTLVMTWTSSITSKTASADASGVITGDATGQIDSTAGIVEFATSALPDSGTQFHYTYDFVDPSKVHSEVFTPSPSGHAVSFTLAHAPVKQHSVVARWTIFAPPLNGGESYRRRYTAIDNGSGGFSYGLAGTNTINYTTGAVVLTVDN